MMASIFDERLVLVNVCLPLFRTLLAHYLKNVEINC